MFQIICYFIATSRLMKIAFNWWLYMFSLPNIFPIHSKLQTFAFQMHRTLRFIPNSSKLISDSNFQIFSRIPIWPLTKRTRKCLICKWYWKDTVLPSDPNSSYFWQYLTREYIAPLTHISDGPALIPVTHLPRFVLDISVKKSDVTTSCKINLWMLWGFKHKYACKF